MIIVERLGFGFGFGVGVAGVEVVEVVAIERAGVMVYQVVEIGVGVTSEEGRWVLEVEVGLGVARGKKTVLETTCVEIVEVGPLHGDG